MSLSMGFYVLWFIMAIPVAAFLWLCHRVNRTTKYSDEFARFMGWEPYDPNRQLGWVGWLGYLVALAFFPSLRQRSSLSCCCMDDTAPRD